MLENQYVKVQLDQHGRLSSMFDKRHSREVIAPGELGNLFKIYEDIPLFWDGWDVGWRARGRGGASTFMTTPLVTPL